MKTVYTSNIIVLKFNSPDELNTDDNYVGCQSERTNAANALTFNSFYDADYHAGVMGLKVSAVNIKVTYEEV